MKEGARAIMAEPLVAQHPLAAQFLFETHLRFDKSAAANGCPRLRPRGVTFLCSTLPSLELCCC
jgi:hypothetical protein